MTDRSDRMPVRGIAAGALFYAVVIWVVHAQATQPFVGGFIYNYYFLSLIEGRLDMPLQIIGLEGHYTPDGRAFVYHGLGPLLVRALAYPFVDLTRFDLLAPSIWLFASIGTASFYILLRAVAGGSTQSPIYSFFLWSLVWLFGPGLILVGNGSFYHEPIGLAFGCTGLFLLCLWRLYKSDFRTGKVLVYMALLAALALLSRPHVAVGLYAVLSLLALNIFWREKWVSLPKLTFTMSILLAAGIGYMGLNALRFGGVAAVDGSPLSDFSAVYGFVYWGLEAPDTQRFVAAAEKGRFYPLRIIPNSYVYTFAWGWDAAVGFMIGWYETVGFVRVEEPLPALLLIWTFWFALGLFGIFRWGRSSVFLWLSLVAALPMAVLVLSYPTVTMRYRVELWPILFVLGVAGLTGLKQFYQSYSEKFATLRPVTLFVCGVIFLSSGTLSSVSGIAFADKINWEWGQHLRSYEDCAAAVSKHPSLGSQHVSRLCVVDAPDSTSGQE